ncbi:MAG: hypothetical protein R3B72_25620 [Polyangiaceae bacterium]
MSVRARAPGKLVVSGAYSVLEGAPALVAAVDRYALAETERPCDFVTPEVREAFARAGLGDRYPWFDASALRGEGRKLGLGSSAAIMIASLAAAWPEEVAPEAWGDTLFALGLASHRAAQGGGSGVDVAAACFGGVLRFALGEGETPEVEPHPLPAVVVECWACSEAASTSAMVARVRALAAAEPTRYQDLMTVAGDGARGAVAATTAVALVNALRQQDEALGQLGEAAEVPILTNQVRALIAAAADEGARFGPSGAGGGDIALFIGPAPSSAGFRGRAEREGLCLLDLAVGAEGVRRLA